MSEGEGVNVPAGTITPSSSLIMYEMHGCDAFCSLHLCGITFFLGCPKVNIFRMML